MSFRSIKGELDLDDDNWDLGEEKMVIDVPPVMYEFAYNRSEIDGRMLQSSVSGLDQESRAPRALIGWVAVAGKCLDGRLD